MSPFKSQGANRAIIDSVILAKHLSSLNKKDAIKNFGNETLKKSLEKVSILFQFQVLASRNRVDLLHDEKEPTNDFIDQKIIDLLKINNIGAWSGDDLFDQIFKILKIHPIK
jgi:hypothetical protein